MGVDRVEYAKPQVADRFRRRRTGSARGNGVGDHGLGGGTEQVALAGYVPVDGTGPGGEALGQRAEREPALARVVEQLDRRPDDAPAGQRLRTPRIGFHSSILTCLERRSKPFVELCSSLTNHGTLFQTVYGTTFQQDHYPATHPEGTP